ncbi:hypothetical protein DB88DRAFT_471095 [Papiliotrema laurentii]|uniref:Uncharacterized protein n=1 Tax=Papiliotrema laurentii TaxID=5418 RepID=A0AAD9FUK0_PAPLA|nr:hypothetical protein DB88DRAFT_471095 [Papiliotrema laurentii]
MDRFTSSSSPRPRWGIFRRPTASSVPASNAKSTLHVKLTDAGVETKLVISPSCRGEDSFKAAVSALTIKDAINHYQWGRPWVGARPVERMSHLQTELNKYAGHLTNTIELRLSKNREDFEAIDEDRLVEAMKRFRSTREHMGRDVLTDNEVETLRKLDQSLYFSADRRPLKTSYSIWQPSEGRDPQLSQLYRFQNERTKHVIESALTGQERTLYEARASYMRAINSILHIFTYSRGLAIDDPKFAQQVNERASVTGNDDTERPISPVRRQLSQLSWGNPHHGQVPTSSAPLRAYHPSQLPIASPPSQVFLSPYYEYYQGPGSQIRGSLGEQSPGLTAAFNPAHNLPFGYPPQNPSSDVPSPVSPVGAGGRFSSMSGVPAITIPSTIEPPRSASDQRTGIHTSGYGSYYQEPPPGLPTAGDNSASPTFSEYGEMPPTPRGYPPTGPW